MRTKTLLLTAVLAVGTVATSMADVFSVNVVGYVNVVCPPGYSMIANPLLGTNSSITALFTSPPEGTSLFKFNGAGYAIAQFVDGNWEGSLPMTVAPGEGVFIQNPSATPYTNTFVGEVVLNSTNPVPAGYAIRSSALPQSGLLQTTLGYPVAEGDSIFKWTGSGYAISQFVDGGWEGAGEPNIPVGNSFFTQKAASANWIRNFTP